MTAYAEPRTMARMPASPQPRRLPPTARFRRRAAIADLLVVAAWASGAMAAALYLASGGANGFGTLADTVTSVGILSGLVGTDFVLVMLVLAARLPLIDRAVGHDRAMALHRKLGKPALYLLLGHGALLLLGYGLSSGVDPVSEFFTLMSVPDMPLAVLGMVLMITVVVTSLIAVRRRFPYEFWYVIHLLSYAAVLTALPHQLSTGSLLAEGTLQRVYWIALYVLALGSIVVFRFGSPVLRSLRHALRVERVEWIAPDVASIHLRGRDLRRLGAEGGQFFSWRFWQSGMWWHAHPVSLSAVPTDHHARITVRVLGAGTKRITSVRPGTAVSFSGPYGLFTDAGRTAPKLAIVAAGIGVTPVRALLEGSSLAPGEATVLLRSSTPDALYLQEEFERLAGQRGAALYTMVGPRPAGADTWMSAHDIERGVTLRSAFPELDHSDLYVCGPPEWTDRVAADARGSGVPEHRIHTERFDW